MTGALSAKRNGTGKTRRCSGYMYAMPLGSECEFRLGSAIHGCNRITAEALVHDLTLMSNSRGF